MSFVERHRSTILVHAGWVIFFLLFLFVSSVSVSWGRIDGLKDILGFALGLSSLMMSVIAIFQSWFSGESISDITRKTEAAVDGFKKTQESISEVMASGATKISSATENLEAARKEISIKIEDIREKLEKIDDAVQKNYEENKISRHAHEGDLKENSSDSTIIEKVSNDRIWRYNELQENITNIGFAILYSCIKSNITKKPIVPNELRKENWASNYMSGYIGGLGAAKVIEFDYNNGKFFIPRVNIIDKDKDFIVKETEQLARKDPADSTAVERARITGASEAVSYFS